MAIDLAQLAEEKKGLEADFAKLGANINKLKWI